MKNFSNFIFKTKFLNSFRIMYDRTRSHYDPYLNELSQDLDDGYGSEVIEETKSYVNHRHCSNVPLANVPFSNTQETLQNADNMERTLLEYAQRNRL